MKYTVIDNAGFEFIFENGMDAWEMVQYIKEVSPNETVKIEVE